MRLGQVSVAHSVLDWMRRNDLEPNVYAYTALLCLPRHVSEAAAPQLLEQARAAGAWGGRRGLGGGIACACGPLAAPHAAAPPASHPAQAQSAYTKMREDGVQPNARFYTGEGPWVVC